MRPGYLKGLGEFWFSGLAGKYFEMNEPMSAEPYFTNRDRVYGKTAEELKAFLYQGIKNRSSVAPLQYNPRSAYWNAPNARQWDQVLEAHKERSQIFKLSD